MGAVIVTGFLVVLALMTTFAAVSLRYVSEANQHLKDIVENNNLKTQLATTMQSALRERALSMHALSVLTDPFDKDEEIQRFDIFGAAYVNARQQFERIPSNPAEQNILARIRELTREAQPEVQAVVDMAAQNDDQELFNRIRNSAMPKQREIAAQVNALLRLQREQTANAVRDAEEAYAEVRQLMLALGAAVLFTGLTIAAFVSRRVNRQARQLATQAMYDPLTGLANRCLLQHRIEHQITQTQRNGTPFGIALTVACIEPRGISSVSAPCMEPFGISA